MFITHTLRASYHQEYVVLLLNMWLIWCLKEWVEKRDKISRVHIYTSNSFLIQNKDFLKVPPPFFRTVY